MQPHPPSIHPHILCTSFPLNVEVTEADEVKQPTLKESDMAAQQHVWDALANQNVCSDQTHYE